MTSSFRFFGVAASLLLASVSAFPQSSTWGWQGHTFINEQAVSFLPPEMSFFIEHTSFLGDHAPDPDQDSEPGVYHYIDIDYYPEFFEGTLPHDINDLAALYSNSIVEENGLVPWVVEIWCDSLTSLMASGQWDVAWQIAAELGHYVGDSHQPLHLTMNYDGQLTGNDGVHSRYETNMVNAHLDEITLNPITAEFWPNVLDSTFGYIDQMYVYVDDIIAADDYAYGQAGNYNNTYYNLMWEELEEITVTCLQKASYDLACIWMTCWINAGSPNPDGVNIQDSSNVTAVTVFPVPCSDMLTIQCDGIAAEHVQITIYDSFGRAVDFGHGQFVQSDLNRIRLNVSRYPIGMYYYSVRMENQETYSGSFVISY
jgi:hypothetical protein